MIINVRYLLNIIYFLCVFLSFFPWTKFGIFDVPGDTQPYSVIAIVIALVVISIILVRYKINILSLANIDGGYKRIATVCSLLSFLSIISIILIDGLSMESLRGLFPYFILLINFIFYFFFIDIRSLSFVFYGCVIACVFWIFVNFVQFFHNKEFLVEFVNRTVLTDDRGLIGLGSEPGYNALILLVLSLVFYTFNYKFFSLFSFLCLVFFTKSAVVILACPVLFFCIYICRSKNYLLSLFFKLPFLAASIFSVLYVLFGVLESSSRFYKLITKISNNDFYYLILDGSFNIRLTHYVGSFFGFLENFFLPNGTLFWVDYISEFSTRYVYFWNSGIQETSRINSGFGTLIFEAGFLGFGIFLCFYYLISKRIESFVKRIIVFFTLLFFFVVVISIKQGFLYPLVFVFCLYQRLYKSCCHYPYPGFSPLKTNEANS